MSPSGYGADNATWVRRLGEAGRDTWQVAIDDEVEGWVHTGLLVADLEPGTAQDVDLGHWEAVVVPLSGSVTVEARTAGEASGAIDRAHLVGRPNVFSGPTDVAYVPVGSSLRLAAEAGPARIAVTLGRVDPTTDGADGPDGVGDVDLVGDVERPVFTHLPAADVPVELRGAGIASREVRNFGVPGVLAARSIIACEVITPAGNWSSWPPHKHDEERPGVETELEEIYYFETCATDARGTDPVGYQRVYASGDRPIDVLAEVRTGDVVLVPHGWHGPAMAAPDAHLYYLNVMAGPGPERAWRICDDPAHAWVRDDWRDQSIDSRLPLGGAR